MLVHVVEAHAAVGTASTGTIHAALNARGLLRATHIADTGFVNSALFVEARERYGLDLVGPTRGPTRGDQPWHAKAGAGFAARDFVVDLAAQRATCPAGTISQSWTPALARGTTPVIKLKFAVTDCRACFEAEYARQAGVEGTIAQGVRSCALRRTPYLGHAKTHLGHLMTAAAMNLVRLLRRLADEPKAQTRCSAFAQLHPLAA